MNVRIILRIISLIMLIVAVIFVICALLTPTMGSVFYIGKWEFGPDQWRVCYAIYAVIMIALFVMSFFIKTPK